MVVVVRGLGGYNVRKRLERTRVHHHVETPCAVVSLRIGTEGFHHVNEKRIRLGLDAGGKGERVERLPRVDVRVPILTRSGVEAQSTRLSQ